MNAARVAIQHDALVVFLLDQREPLAVGTQAGETRDEVFLTHAEKLRDARDFIFLDPHVAGPLAAIRTALTDIEYRGIEIDPAVARAAVILVWHRMRHAVGVAALAG